MIVRISLLNRKGGENMKTAYNYMDAHRPTNKLLIIAKGLIFIICFFAIFAIPGTMEYQTALASGCII